MNHHFDRLPPEDPTFIKWYTPEVDWYVGDSSAVVCNDGRVMACWYETYGYDSYLKIGYAESEKVFVTEANSVTSPTLLMTTLRYGGGPYPRTGCVVFRDPFGTDPKTIWMLVCITGHLFTCEALFEEPTWDGDGGGVPEYRFPGPCLYKTTDDGATWEFVHWIGGDLYPTAYYDNDPYATRCGLGAPIIIDGKWACWMVTNRYCTPDWSDAGGYSYTTSSIVQIDQDNGYLTTPISYPYSNAYEWFHSRGIARFRSTDQNPVAQLFTERSYNDESNYVHFTSLCGTTVAGTSPSYSHPVNGQFTDRDFVHLDAALTEYSSTTYNENVVGSRPRGVFGLAPDFRDIYCFCPDQALTDTFYIGRIGVEACANGVSATYPGTQWELYATWTIADMSRQYADTLPHLSDLHHTQVFMFGRNLIHMPRCPEPKLLHVPYKRWLMDDQDLWKRKANWETIERWAGDIAAYASPNDYADAAVFPALWFPYKNPDQSTAYHDEQNWLAFERWVDATCWSKSDALRPHIPYKRRTADPQDEANFVYLERWVTRIIQRLTEKLE